MKSDSVGKTHQIDTVLEKLLKKQGFEDKIVEQKVFVAWKHAVGDLIARGTQPISLVDAKLTVYALSHPLVTELSLLQQHIIRKLNAAIGQPVVKKMRFQVKPPRPSPRQGTQRSSPCHRLKMLEEVELPGNVVEQVEQTVADVTDPGLKASLRRLFISQRQRATIDESN